MKETFILYTSYKDAIMVLSDEQAGRLLKAIFEYATTGIKQEIDDTAVKFAYMLIVSQIESSNRQYEKKCERLRANIQKRWNTNVSNDVQDDTEVSDEIQSHTKEYKSIQKNTDVCLDRYDRYDRYDRKNKEEDTNKKKDEPSLCAGAQSSSSSDYSSVVDYWNAAVEKHGSAMRPLRGLTENRKAAIRARLREHKQEGMEAIRQMIDKAVVSDFLNGRNSRNAIFTFDRLMSPSMFQKTLEGNFDNAEQAPQEQQPTSIGKLMQEQQAEPKDEQQEQRERFEAMIELCEKNPKHRCMAALRMAYENKTLQSLGISWKPSDAER